jgi:hypothetical protein
VKIVHFELCGARFRLTSTLRGSRTAVQNRPFCVIPGLKS